MKTGAEFAVKKLADVSVADTVKTYAETKKIDAETKAIEYQNESQLSPEDKKYKEQLEIENKLLDMREKEAKIKALEIENQRNQLKFISELSEALGKGILNVDMINVSLGDIPLIVKKNGALEIGNIDEIL